SVRSGVELLEDPAPARPDVLVKDRLNAGRAGISSIARMRMHRDTMRTPSVLTLPYAPTPAVLERLTPAAQTVARGRGGRVHATAELLRKAAGVGLESRSGELDRNRRESSG